MVTPRANSFTVASGAIYGGRAGMPAWRAGRTPLTWYEMPIGNVLYDVDPGNNPAINPNYPGRAPWTRLAAGNTNSSSNRGVLIPWCGSEHNELTGDIDLPLGGGHSDYGGNEYYRLNAAADVPLWSMIKPPSGSTPYLNAEGIPAGATLQGNSFLLDNGKETTGVYADGRPRAPHSYRKSVYVPGVGMIMSVLGGAFSSGGTGNKSTWLFNEATKEWEFKVEPAGGMGVSSGGGACYDSLRNRVYFALPGTSPVKRLNPTTWTWDNLTASITNSGNAACFYAPEIDRVIWVGHTTGRFAVINPATGAVSFPTTDAIPFTMSAPMGLDWIPGLGLMLHRHDINTGDVHVLVPPANPDTGNWALTQLATVGTPPAESNVSGVGWWSRVKYSKRFKGIYRLTDHTTKPWFLPLE